MHCVPPCLSATPGKPSFPAGHAPPVLIDGTEKPISWLRFRTFPVYPAATMTAQARINADVLLRARESARLTIEQLAKGVNAKPEQVMAWEGGEAFPTFRQAQHLAATAHVAGKGGNVG